MIAKYTFKKSDIKKHFYHISKTITILENIQLNPLNFDPHLSCPDAYFF